MPSKKFTKRSDDEDMKGSKGEGKTPRTKNPMPRSKNAATKRRADRNKQPEFVPEAEEEEENGSDGSGSNETSKMDNNQHSSSRGLQCCNKYQRLQSGSQSSLTHIRTLYSKFPRDNLKLTLLHVGSTFLLYLLVYPVINFTWTYFSNVDEEVITLFNYVTDGPTNDAGFVNHFRHMKWLRWPPMTAESVSLLAASAIKDAIALQWEGIMEDMSLRDMIGCRLAKQRR